MKENVRKLSKIRIWSKLGNIDSLSEHEDKHKMEDLRPGFKFILIRSNIELKI